MQQKPLANITDADRAAALRRLIDRQLLQAQMVEERYMRPSDAIWTPTSRSFARKSPAPTNQRAGPIRGRLTA